MYPPIPSPCSWGFSRNKLFLQRWGNVSKNTPPASTTPHFLSCFTVPSFLFVFSRQVTGERERCYLVGLEASGWGMGNKKGTKGSFPEARAAAAVGEFLIRYCGTWLFFFFFFRAHVPELRRSGRRPAMRLHMMPVFSASTSAAAAAGYDTLLCQGLQRPIFASIFSYRYIAAAEWLTCG